MYLLPYSSHTSQTPLNLLCHSKTDARFMQDAPKAVWSIPYVSVAFFPSLKQNFIGYRSSKMSSRQDCIFKIYQLWQSGFSQVYSNCCGSCSFEPEILKIGQSSHKMYSNNSEFSRVYDNFRCLYKKFWKLIDCTTYMCVCERERERERERGRECVCMCIAFYMWITNLTVRINTAYLAKLDEISLDSQILMFYISWRWLKSRILSVDSWYLYSVKTLISL